MTELTVNIGRYIIKLISEIAHYVIQESNADKHYDQDTRIAQTTLARWLAGSQFIYAGPL